MTVYGIEMLTHGVADKTSGRDLMESSKRFYRAECIDDWLYTFYR